MIRTFDSVRLLATTSDVGRATWSAGPPSPPERSIVRPRNGLSDEPPFPADLSSVIARIVARGRYPGGVSQGLQVRHHVPADRLQVRRIVDAGEVEDHVLGARIGELTEAVDDVGRRVDGEV